MKIVDLNDQLESMYMDESRRLGKIGAVGPV